MLRRGAGERAADLAAEVFVVAWRQRAQWLGLPWDERTAWLYGVARKLLANAYLSGTDQTCKQNGLARLIDRK